jgi:hypothetical protein
MILLVAIHIFVYFIEQNKYQYVQQLMLIVILIIVIAKLANLAVRAVTGMLGQNGQIHNLALVPHQIVQLELYKQNVE